MSDSILQTIGKLLDSPQERDAIHIAIAPVTATEKLYPGQGIDFARHLAPNGVRKSDAPHGIVDPFLTQPVFPGERFWMFMMPGSITSLRHAWTHPAFVNEKPLQAEIPAYDDVGPLTVVQERSSRWIRDFADQYDIDYDDLIEAANEYVRSGQYFSRGDLLEGAMVPDEFWPHFENVTCQVVEDGKRGSFFSCSC